MRYFFIPVYSLCTFLIITVFYSLAGAAYEYTFTGKAYNDNGSLVYTEEHRVILQNNKTQKTHTNYYSSEGTLIATLTSDYTLYDYVPLYTFKDIRGQKEDGIYKDGNSLVKYRIFSKGKETKKFDYESDMVAGQALSYFIIDHLSELKENPDKEYYITFIVPNRLNTFDFRIKKIVRKAQRENILTVRIESSSWIFRLVAPYIEAEYDIVNKRLINYWGPSNLDDEKGDAQKVYIQYTY